MKEVRWRTARVTSCSSPSAPRILTPLGLGEVPCTQTLNTKPCASVCTCTFACSGWSFRRHGCLYPVPLLFFSKAVAEVAGACGDGCECCYF